MKGAHAILIADDDMFFRGNIEKYLLSKGYQAKAVASGQEAVKEMLKEKYDALIMDVYMNGLSGTELIAVVKDVCASIPIIVITGDSSIELERSIRCQGVFSYLLKPFAMEELGNMIASAIRSNKSGVNSE